LCVADDSAYSSLTRIDQYTQSPFQSLTPPPPRTLSISLFLSVCLPVSRADLELEERGAGSNMNTAVVNILLVKLVKFFFFFSILISCQLEPGE